MKVNVDRKLLISQNEFDKITHLMHQKRHLALRPNASFGA
jgi:hypothetical protein